jgi:broad specificity phosphatase PhoE
VLLLVRHGRTAANASGLLLGHADPPLDDTGRAQAAALGPACASVVRVVCSPLQRARETAAALGAPVEVDERWIELDYGEYDQVPISDVPAEAWGRWRRDLDFTPPGGESLRSLGRRVQAACEELAPAAVHEDIAVVTHVSPIKAATAWALGVGDEVAWRLYVAPGSLTRIGITDRGPILRSFNEPVPPPT